MTVTCIPSTSYSTTDEFITRSTHIITAISFPIHILGLYIILFKTPQQMSSVKWYFVNLHSWIVIYDYSLGILTCPMLLLPTMSGYILGLLSYLGPIGGFYAFALVKWTCTYVLLSILAIFENRFYIICEFPWKSYWEKIRMSWLGIHYLIGFLIFIPMWFLIPEQDNAKKRVFERLPCLSADIRNSPIFVVTEDYTYHLTALFSLLMTGVVEAAIFLISLIYYILHQLRTKRMSRTTVKLQVKFLGALLIQTMVPGFMMVFPLIYLSMAIMYEYYNQAYMNIGMVIETTHGLVSTLTMIFIHHPYRTALFKMIFRWKKIERIEANQANQGQLSI